VGWTKFYKGEVTAVNSRDGTYDIKFEDGERKRGVEKSRVRSLDSGSSDRDRDSRSSSSSIREGDKVEAKCTGWTKFYKGEVTRVNSDDTYDIKFEDGERKRGIRSDQVRSLGGSRGGGGSTKDSDKDRGSSSSISSLREGDKVEAKCVGWTKFYKGEVTRVNSDDTYDIKFEDGERKRGVEKSRVRSLDSGSSDRDQDRNHDAFSSSGSAPIREGDKVEAKCTGWTKYYKGNVTRVNSDDTYDITFEDGEKKKSVRSDQIKASSKKIEEGASVRARYRGANGYTRGTISAVNRDGTYDIKYNDGLKE